MKYKEYNRYELLNNNNNYEKLPYINIPNNDSDKYVNWILGKSRMDILSYDYYGNPLYDFIILYGNGEYLSEFDIPDGEIIRIPFPLEKALNDYINELEKKLKS